MTNLLFLRGHEKPQLSSLVTGMDEANSEVGFRKSF
jgi:hypothetical protein